MNFFVSLEAEKILFIRATIISRAKEFETQTVRFKDEAPIISKPVSIIFSGSLPSLQNWRGSKPVDNA